MNVIMKFNFIRYYMWLQLPFFFIGIGFLVKGGLPMFEHEWNYIIPFLGIWFFIFLTSQLLFTHCENDFKKYDEAQQIFQNVSDQ